MTVSKIHTADDVLKHLDGNISKAAEYLRISAPTLRKHRDNGTLPSIIIIDGSVYMYKNDVYGVLPIKDDDWERINVPVQLNRLNAHLYRTTYENGRTVFWRKKHDKV